MIATLVNVAAVLAGGILGLLFRGRISGKIADGITKAIGLCVLIIGISGALKGDFMLLVVSLALGALLGELLRIDDGLNKCGDFMQRKFAKKDAGESRFSEGFVSASLLFCVGAMSIVGSLQSGLTGDRSVIYAKSVIDGVSAMVLASTLGAGVLFSVLPIFIYQGAIELAATFFGSAALTVSAELMITQISAAGSIMIMAIGVNLAMNTKIKTANLLPGLLVAVAYFALFMR